VSAAPASESTADTWSWTGVARRGDVVFPEPSRSIAGRYRLVDLLGEGGSGQVWRARDTLLDEDVAVKLVAAAGGVELDRARREVVALRWARLPGVVGLRDDGSLPEAWFLVMDLVPGLAFPGRPGPLSWPTLAPLARRLMEVLAGMHAAGVVHRDLKPANVLVEPGGNPVLVDFGLARGQALGQHWNRAGTPRYVAPEQALGDPCGPPADLYAVGVMLYEALSGGFLPQRGSSGREILQERVSEPPRGLREVAPEVPARVARAVDRLVALRPEDRFASALEVMQALGGRPPLFLGHTLRSLLEGRRSLSAEQLQVLFRGPDHFLHLREDAAAVLWARTGGHPEAIGEEVQAWLQAGLCTWDGPLLRVQRVAIERLRTDIRLAVAPPSPPTLSLDALHLLDAAQRAWPDTHEAVLAEVSELGPQALAEARQELVGARLAWELPDGRLGLRPVALSAADPYGRAVQAQIAAALPADGEARLRHLVGSDAPMARVLPVAEGVVQAMLAEGRHHQALAVVEMALPLCRARAELLVHEERLLELWAALSLNLGTRTALDRALYETGRAQLRTGRVEQVEGLLYAALARFSNEPERCEELLRRVPAFVDDELETWRMAVGFTAARRVSAERGAVFLEGLESWAGRGGALRRQRLRNWEGELAYMQGRYAEAARLRLEVAGEAGNQAARLSAGINAAFAWLDAGELAEASRRAAEAKVTARWLRQPLFEARAVCAERQALYRSRLELEADPSLVEAAAALDRRLMAQMCIAEAGFAFRGGNADLALHLARQGAQAFREVGFDAGALTLEALAFACEGGVQSSRGLALVDAARHLPDRSWAVQILGLVRLASGDRLVSETVVARRAEGLTASEPDRIIDLLSLGEALRGRLDPRPPSLPS